jgi:hypothetical protein
VKTSGGRFSRPRFLEVSKRRLGRRRDQPLPSRQEHVGWNAEAPIKLPERIAAPLKHEEILTVSPDEQLPALFQIREGVRRRCRADALEQVRQVGVDVVVPREASELLPCAVVEDEVAAELLGIA